MLEWNILHRVDSLVNIGFPMVRTDGRAYGHVITKFSWMGRLPHVLSYGALPTHALHVWWSFAISLNFYLCCTLCRICHHSFLALGFTDASCISWRYFYEPCCPKHGNRVLTKAAKNFLFLIKDRHLKSKKQIVVKFPLFQ